MQKVRIKNRSGKEIVVLIEKILKNWLKNLK